jgi:hypothetical protein
MRVFSLIFLVSIFSIPAYAQPVNTTVVPTGWKCVDKVTADGQKYQICSPPSPTAGVPFFLWAKDPATQATKK